SPCRRTKQAESRHCGAGRGAAGFNLLSAATADGRGDRGAALIDLHAAVLDRGAGRLAGKKFLKTVALDRGADLGTENVLLAAGQHRTAAEAAFVDYQNPAGTDRRRVRGSAGE